MNIGSTNTYPSNKLSNFASHPFVFDNIEVKSMEGLLQAFKFRAFPSQIVMCSRVGIHAKRKGKPRNKFWQQTQTLYWKNIEYKRNSIEYQLLLDRAYQAMYDQSESFRNALHSANTTSFTHSIGHNKQSMTVLTEREFCSRLSKLANGERLI